MNKERLHELLYDIDKNRDNLNNIHDLVIEYVDEFREDNDPGVIAARQSYPIPEPESSNDDIAAAFDAMFTKEDEKEPKPIPTVSIDIIKQRLQAQYGRTFGDD